MMTNRPITREHMARVDAALERARAEAASGQRPSSLPHPDDARPIIVRMPSRRDVETAILSERTRLARQYPSEKEPMPPPGLVASARLP
jgi:hypothetical protein